MSVMSKRKKYGDQFKAEAVELVLLTGRSINEVASELGLNAGTLGNWVRAHREANPDPVTALSASDSARKLMSILSSDTFLIRIKNLHIR